MPAIVSRSFSPADLPDLLAFVSRNAAARWPAPAYLMTGDVAWRLPGSAPAQNLRLWYDDAGLAGYVWFEPTTGMEFDVRAELGYDGVIADEMLEWGESRRRAFAPAYPRFVDLTSMAEWADEVVRPRSPQPWDGLCLTSIAFEADAPRVEYLQRSGFEPTRHFAPNYRRDLAAPIAHGALAAGMRLRHVGADDLDERVACHRAAWVGSTWTLETYLEVRANDVYDPELDIVLETADGRFASYCICWADPQTGVGYFEPVGTRPEWRGRGVGRAIIYEGFRRLKAKGMHTARVDTAGFNAPAQRLYESCGFERIGTCRTFMKRL